MADDATDTREVILIVKQDCSLCDDARAVVSSLTAEMGLAVREVDLVDDPESCERYQYAVPVVCANGLPLLSGHINKADLRQEVERAFGRDPLAGVPSEEPEFLPVLRCPVCDGHLQSRPRAVACLRCGKEYERRDGVLMLMAAPEREPRVGIMDWIGRLLEFRLEGQGERK